MPTPTPEPGELSTRKQPRGIDPGGSPPGRLNPIPQRARAPGKLSPSSMGPPSLGNRLEREGRAPGCLPACPGEEARRCESSEGCLRSLCHLGGALSTIHLRMQDSLLTGKKHRPRLD